MVKQIKSGQVGLVLLVVMAVVIALVMSIAVRSLSDTVLSRQEKESSAAFSVAETGIENALNLLRQGSVPSGQVALSDSTGLVTGVYAVTPVNTYSLFLREGEVAHINLSGFGGGDLTLSWTKKGDVSEDVAGCVEGSGTMPAGLEVVGWSADGVSVARSYYNPSNCNIAGNGFLASVDGGSNFRSSTTYTVALNTNMVRIRPIYSGATVTVTGSGLSANQMYIIQSSAAGGDAEKEIEVKRGLDAPATVFDYAVFSGETIVK